MNSKWIKTALVATTLVGFSHAALAQVENDGKWKSRSVSYSLQKPYDKPASERFSASGNSYTLWAYKTDKPHFNGSNTAARSELKLSPGYTRAAQFQATYKVDKSTDIWTIFQAFGEEGKPANAFPHALELVWRRDGDSKNGYLHWYWADPVVAKIKNGDSFTLNVVHYPKTCASCKGTITVYINGVKKHSAPDNGASSYYFKTGVYAQFPYSAVSNQGKVTVSNIKIWTKD